MPSHDATGTSSPAARLSRITTYNVHRCLGTDGQLSPQRIAEVIAACEPDIVALQELDVGRLRTGGIDQAHAIASELGMQLHFHPALKVMEELYGDAILTARPSRLVKAGALPSWSGWPKLEPRGALWAAIHVDGVDLQIINTHLGLRRHERMAQVEELLGPAWYGDPRCKDPVVLLGDFNSNPWSGAYRQVARTLLDAQVAAGYRWPQPTFPTYLPTMRIDHVFVSRSVEVLASTVMRTPLARKASDHLPLTVDVRLGQGSPA